MKSHAQLESIAKLKGLGCLDIGTGEDLVPLMQFANEEFLNRGNTIDILGWIILFHGRLSCILQGI